MKPENVRIRIWWATRNAARSECRPRLPRAALHAAELLLMHAALAHDALVAFIIVVARLGQRRRV